MNLGDSVAEGGEVKFKSPSVKVSVDSFLHKRNGEGLGTKIEKIGDVWKSNKTGQIYRDSFYYVEQDFGWVNGITGAESIQSRISGVGMKVVVNEGKPIVAGKEGITWKHLREYTSWIGKTRGKLKKEKKIKIKRVPYWEIKNKDGSTQIIDLSEGTCIVNVGSMDLNKGIYAYLVIGFAQGSGKNEGNGKYRLSWENADKNFLVKNYGCKNLPWHKGSKLRLRPDWSWNAGEGNWSARKDSMIVLGNDSGIIQIGGDEERPIVAVVLGLFVDRVTVVEDSRPKDWYYTNVGEDNWKKILGNEGKEWRKRELTGEKNYCLNQGSGEQTFEFNETCLASSKRLDSFKRWQKDITLTYSYEFNQ